MPVERGYEQQLAPREAAPMPLASAETYGAGLGREMAQAGEDMHQRQVRAYELERQAKADREAADFMHRFALHRQNMDGITRELRTNAAPGADGHVTAIDQANEGAREGLFAGITEERVLRAAQRQWDDFRTGLLSTEGDFEVGRQVAKRVTDISGASDVAANRIGTKLESYPEEVRALYAAIDAMPGLDADLRAKLKREQVDQKLGIAYLNQLNGSNPALARSMLDAGTFDEILTPEQKQQLRNGSEVEIRRQEAEVRQQVSLAKAELTEQIATVTARAGAGIDVSAELPDLIAGATAIGDTSAVENLKQLRRESEFARVWGGVSPLAREARLRELTAVAESKRTDDQQAEIRWLQDKGGALDSAFRADPVGWALERAPAGSKPPPIDWNDPATLAERVRWSRTAAQAYGSMGLLSGNERQAMATRMQDGQAGYAEVLEGLARFGGREARQAAREVAPSDPLLQHLVTLPAEYRKIALNGRRALQGNSGLLKVDDDAEREDINRFTAQFRRATRMLPEDERSAVIEAAQKIAAGHLIEGGGRMNGRLWGLTLNMAMGAMGTSGGNRRGGLGNWQGQWFVVPPNMKAQEFTDRVFAEQRRKPAAGPLNPDGTPLNLREAVPVFVGNGTYQFYVGDQVVMTRGPSGKIDTPWRYRVGGGR